jgi:sugar/nucleoside kinase (ribokinase family)
MTPEIVFIGHIVKEMIHFPDKTVGPVLGSPAAYGSVIAGSLGASVGVVTRIGADMPPELLTPFHDAGVDTRGIKQEGEHTTASLLIYAPSGDKEIRYPHQAAPLLLEDIPADYLGARGFHVCPMDWDMPLESIVRLRRLSAILSVDLGGYGGAHSRGHPSPAEQENPEVLAHLVSHFDVVRASVEDCRHLLGSVEYQLEATASRFVEWGAQVGIISLGARGALLATRDGHIQVPALPGPVVDTTGAGDAFSSGFLVEYLRTRDPERAARFASAVSKHVIEGTGGVAATRMPTRRDIEDRLKQVAVKAAT